MLENIRSRFSQAGYEAIVVEHGSADVPSRADGVRHPHVHVASIVPSIEMLANMTASLSPFVRVVDVVSDWETVYEVASQLPEYVIVGWRQHLVIGVNPKAPQVSRTAGGSPVPM